MRTVAIARSQLGQLTDESLVYGLVVWDQGAKGAQRPGTVAAKRRGPAAPPTLRKVTGMRLKKHDRARPLGPVPGEPPQSHSAIVPEPAHD